MAHRIDDADRLIDGNGAGRDGFTEGSAGPPLVAATVVLAKWLNMAQEEICRAVELNGGTLSDANNEQLGTIISAIRTAYAAGPGSSTDNAIARFDGTTGKLLQDSGIQVTDGAELAYTSPPTRTIEVFPSPMGGSWSAGYATVVCTTNSGISFFDFSDVLRSGMVITGIAARVKPGAARATSGNRVGFEPNYWTGDGTAGTQTIFGGSIVRDDGTTNWQSLSVTGLSHTVDRSANRYVIRMYGGNDAATNNDNLSHFVLTVTDAGPRNF